MFGGKMCQLCRKQDYAEILTLNKIDNKIQSNSEMKSTSESYPQFKLLNRMHIIFANFYNLCLIFLRYFFTGISSFTQLFYVAFYIISLCVQNLGSSSV